MNCDKHLAPWWVRRSAVWAAMLLVCGFIPSFWDVAEARNVCRTYREGNATVTVYCEDGYQCAPNNKCKMGPELKARMERPFNQAISALEQMQRNLEEMRRNAERQARNFGRMALQADRRAAARSSCSTITGLGDAGGASSASCSTTGGMRFASAPAHDAHRGASLQRSLPPGIAPPGTAFVVATGDLDTAREMENILRGLFDTSPRPAPTAGAATAGGGVSTPARTPEPAAARSDGCKCPPNTIHGSRQYSQRSLHPPPPDCRFKGGEMFNDGADVVVWTNLEGKKVEIRPRHGLWLERGAVTAVPIDKHPQDARPKIAGDDYGCLAPMAHANTDAATGWVSLRCEMGRDRYDHKLTSPCE